jgi:hypothetical protein
MVSVSIIIFLEKSWKYKKSVDFVHAGMGKEAICTIQKLVALRSGKK